MIRRFRLKFISIVLITVFAILTIFGITINVIVINETYNNSNNFIDNFYEFITQTNYLSGRTNADAGLPIDSGLFFVRIQNGKDILSDDLENIVGMETDEACRLSEAAFNSNDERGIVGDYRYCIYTDDIGDQIIVFEKFDDNIMFLHDLKIASILAGVVIFLIAAMLTIPISNNVTATVAEQINIQNEFVTHASHDLKTPIAVISANMDVLSLTDKDNKWVQSTKKQVMYLKKLVSHMITVSKLSEKNHTVSFEKFNLSTAVYDITGMFAHIAKSKNLTFTQDIESDIYMYGNEFYIRQLITILCENAVNYSNENGKIELSLYSRKNNICFTVYNTRDPNDNLDMNKLFDRFYRGDKSRSSDKYGNGLGLSMAKSISEMHSGTITAHCKTEDSITFTVTLKG